MLDSDPITVGNLKQILCEILVEKLDEKFNLLRAENEIQRKRIEKLEEDVDSLESYTRRNDIIIHGITEKSEENPIAIAMEICKVVGIEINVGGIDMAHRLPKSKNAMVDTPPPFILRLVSHFRKEEIIN